jgi:hypothetical protein
VWIDSYNVSLGQHVEINLERGGVVDEFEGILKVLKQRVFPVLDLDHPIRIALGSIRKSLDGECREWSKLA